MNSGIESCYSEIPVIIMSCDAYSDIWPVMAESFGKFWPACPFPVYLCSEQKSFYHPWINNIRIGRQLKWGEMLLEVLDHLHSDHLIYLQEDYVLKGTVNNPAILKQVEFFSENNAAYLRLIPFPPPDEICDPELNIGKINFGSRYMTSLQAAIWDKSVLQNLVLPSDNGWIFERESIRRAAGIKKTFYSVGLNSNLPNKNHHRYPLDYYSTAVLQGKWQKEAVKILRNAGLVIEPGERGVLTRWDFYYYHQMKRKKGIYTNLLTLLDQLIFNRRKKYRKF